MSNLVKITDIVDFNPKRAMPKGCSAPFIDMASLPTNARDIKNITKKDFKGSGSKFMNGDTLFARITPCLENGKTAKVSGLLDGEHAHGSTEFIVMSAKDSLYDEDFVYYIARLPELRSYAAARMEGTSGRQRVQWQALAEFEYNFPEKHQRKKIAAILMHIDDKIENNRQMNETLEQMARAIFKSWFVDFDPVHAKAAGKKPARMDAATAALFPDSFGENGLPMGWKYGKLGDVSDLRWGDTNTTKKSYADNGYPAFSASGQDGLLPYFDFEKTGIVISAIGANCGKTWLAQGKWSCIKNTIRFWSVVDYLPTVYLFHATNSNDFWPIRGSAQPFISQGDALLKKILLPNNQEAKVFGAIVGIYYKKITANNKENKALAELRDILLPKLMSGEIRIKDAEHEVGTL